MRDFSVKLSIFFSSSFERSKEFSASSAWLAAPDAIALLALDICFIP